MNELLLGNSFIAVFVSYLYRYSISDNYVAGPNEQCAESVVKQMLVSKSKYYLTVASDITMIKMILFAL